MHKKSFSNIMRMLYHSPSKKCCKNIFHNGLISHLSPSVVDNFNYIDTILLQGVNYVLFVKLKNSLPCDYKAKSNSFDFDD